jgi:hypothetical protein
MQSDRDRVVQHIVDQTAALSKLARDNDLDRLAYLLDSVRREARRFLKNDSENSP